MKLLSGLIGFIIAVFAVCFALSNRQAASLSLWPFNVDIAAPVYLISLGTLVFGLVSGAVVTWLAMIPHRLRHRRLQREVAQLNAKILDLQQTILSPRNRDDEGQGVAHPNFRLPKFKARFWETK